MTGLVREIAGAFRVDRGVPTGNRGKSGAYRGFLSVVIAFLLQESSIKTI